MKSYGIVNEDCLDLLRGLDDNSIDLVLTITILYWI